MSEGTTIKPLTLPGLADGAALELWNEALHSVLESIDNPNTDHKAKRRITLDVSFTCDEERQVGEVEIRCSTKLPGYKGVKSLVSYGRHRGERVVVEHPRQPSLFPEPEAKLRAVEHVKVGGDQL